MNVENQIIGDVKTVECEGCRIDAGRVHVAALGLTNIEICVKGGIVTVSKRKEKE